MLFRSGSIDIKGATEDLTQCKQFEALSKVLDAVELNCLVRSELGGRRVVVNGGSEADGLVHITAIRDGFVENTEDEAEVGQEVQVRVISFDKEKRRIGLSMLEWSEDGPKKRRGGGGGARSGDVGRRLRPATRRPERGGHGRG